MTVVIKKMNRSLLKKNVEEVGVDHAKDGDAADRVAMKEIIEEDGQDQMKSKLQLKIYKR